MSKYFATATAARQLSSTNHADKLPRSCLFKKMISNLWPLSAPGNLKHFPMDLPKNLHSQSRLDVAQPHQPILQLHPASDVPMDLSTHPRATSFPICHTSSSGWTFAVAWHEKTEALILLTFWCESGTSEQKAFTAGSKSCLMNSSKPVPSCHVSQRLPQTSSHVTHLSDSARAYGGYAPQKESHEEIKMISFVFVFRFPDRSRKEVTPCHPQWG